MKLPQYRLLKISAGKEEIQAEWSDFVACKECDWWDTHGECTRFVYAEVRPEGSVLRTKADDGCKWGERI